MKKGTIQMKRILSITLAAIMILSMSIPAAAAETEYITKTSSSKLLANLAAPYNVQPNASGTLYVTVETDRMVKIEVFDINSKKEIFPDDYRGKVNERSYPREYLIQAYGNKKETASFEYSVREGEYYTLSLTASMSGKATNYTITYRYPSAEAESKNNTNNTKTTSPIMTIDLKKGSSLQLGAEFPSNAKITWETSKKSVATVSSNGKVTAVAAGSTTIKATAGNKSVKIKIKVS